MKQLTVNHLFYFLLLIILILFLSSCKEESNPVDNNSVFSSTTKTITTATGGTLEITDKNANRIKLIIPPLAVRDTTKITLEILNSVEPNPFSQNILSTIRILPDGLQLDSAATLQINFSSEISDTDYTILYYLKSIDEALPLKLVWFDNKTVRGEIYHFSDYGGAKPTKDETISQSNKLRNNYNFDVWDFARFNQYVVAMLEWIWHLDLYGEEGLSEQLRNELNQVVLNQCNNFLDQQIPDDPCGFYLNTLFKYHTLFCTICDPEDPLGFRFNDRINNVLNRCYTRGELEFAYDFCASAEGVEICRTITGFIPFTVNTTVEPHGQINGSGDLDWNGTGTGLPPNCFYTEVGTVNVTLGGNMVVDEYNVLWMDFEIHEHASGTVTVMCDGIGTVNPFNPPDVTHNIRILAQEGSELIMPIPGASSGHFKWILHITFSR